MACVPQIAAKRETQSRYKRCKSRKPEVASKQKHEYGGKNMRQNVELVVHALGEHSIAVQRHHVCEELERVEKAGLHLSDECDARESIRVPDGQNALVDRGCREVVPGVTLGYRLPLPQDGKLLRERNSPIEKQYRDEEEQYPPGRSHEPIVTSLNLT